MKTVSPSVRCKVAINSSNSAPIGSRPDVGSSRNNNSGSSASALAKAARLVMPPDSSEEYLLAASGLRPASSILSIASSSERRGDNCKCSRIGTSTFCLTVSPENRASQLLWQSLTSRDRPSGYGSSPSRCGPAAVAERSIARSPGSRARSVCTCQGL
jgi:hypothetical protein